MRLLGIDLAWKDGSEGKLANETGVVALEPSGEIVAAGWTVGIEETFEWISGWASEETIAFVDAPLVVTNPPGTQRRCERDVGRREQRGDERARRRSPAGATRSGGVEV